MNHDKVVASISDSMAKWQNSNPGSIIYYCSQVTSLYLSLLIDKTGMTVLLQRAAVTVKEKISRFLVSRGQAKPFVQKTLLGEPHVGTFCCCLAF